MAPTFEVARLEHALDVSQMRVAAGERLTERLGPGNWAGTALVPSIKERIRSADPTLHRSTLFVAVEEGRALASVALSTFAPGFWKKSLWSEPGASALGVFALVVHPDVQRQGLGRFVMAQVEGVARGRGIPFVRLDAYSANPGSNAFYEALGYDRRAVIDLRGTGLVLYEKRVLPRP
ncbi:MAG: GNAT family N-acetyltransferase [Armatimonadetes bacterium]|nr:GNAT family N-acetyltransferase [Armatimonadota bacterium]